MEIIEQEIKDYSRLLEGKNVFISTAARGIGKSIALLFARQGAVIYFGGRNRESVETTCQELAKIMPGCRGYVCDLGDGGETEQIGIKVLEDSGGIDVLVNTVGINCQCDVTEYTDEDMFRLLETNYLSGLRLARLLVPGMKDRKQGSIIQISSIHSCMTQPGNMLYAGTKGAMNAAARAMALDFAEDDIRVNTICPGLIMSDVVKDDLRGRKTEEEREAFWETCRHCQPLPPGRMCDVANAALYFASDMSAYVTGQALMVDGGTSIKAHDFF